MQLSKINKSIFLVLLTALSATPFSVLASNLPVSPDSEKPGFTGEKIEFPEGTLVQALAPFFIRVITVIIAVVGLLTVALIIYNGYLLVTSGGNDQQVQTGKKGLFNSILGLVLSLAAYIIIYTIASALKINI